MTLLTDAPITRSITTNTGIAAIPVNGLGNVGLFMTLTGVTSGNFSFEASIDSTDGVNGNWFLIPGMLTNATALQTATGALSATPAFGWQFDVTCFNYFRVRATAGTFGTAALWFAPGENPKFNTVAMAATGTGAAQVQGAGATGSPAVGNPVLAAGRVTIANATAEINLDALPLAVDGAGKLIVKSFSSNELDWQATMASDGAAITVNTVVALIAAAATFRRYITAIQLHNSSATATEVVLQDTTGTPVVLWRGFLPASMTQPYNVEFPTPLRTGSGTASGIGLRAVTAAANIRWSIQGFVGY